ncbi:MAG: sugar ABC transporter ATP-binding protein [Dongiaceae bacterium]
MTTAPLLEMRGISKSFPGVQALSEVRLDLAAGEVHALMGENGAGKSTLVKILCGIYQPDAGTIRLDGRPVAIASPTAALTLGISPVHQEVNLQPYLSVAENIFLGRLPRNRLGLVDGRRLRREAAAILDSLGVPLDPAQPLGALPVAGRQIAAIARAVSTEARILIFDEPTSSLSEREAALLLDMIRRLRDRGLGILYISHRMEEIFRLCDRITVFRDGRHIATRPAAETSLREIIQLMIGRDLGDLFRKQAAPIGAPVLEVRGLGRRGLLHDISFTVRRGEIVGLAGLVGAGRTELARALFGDLAIDQGEIRIEGRPARPRSPRQAIAAGIGLVPEDRKDQGLVTALSVQQNISLPMLRALSRGSIVDTGAEKRLAVDYVRRLAIRTPSPDQKVKFLSGGNQQRVVIAKWLATRPKLLIVDEPTRGIDVGAKAEIHALLCDLAREGVAILMISSDLPEILAMSDRVLVMHQGRLAGKLPAATATQEAIMHYATGTA